MSCYLEHKNDNLIFVKDNNNYYLTSHPYEPCLYIKSDDKIIAIIHNSFDVDTLIDVVDDNKKTTAITGSEYDKDMICDLLSYVIDNSLYDTDISYIENNMEDIFYKEYKKYDDCVLDYCIVKTNSHKEAVLFAMNKWRIELDFDFIYDESKMKSYKIESKDFFDISMKDEKSYCYLFLKPPHGSKYKVEDFIKINNLLFPNGLDDLDIYEWSNDWSNYFDDGLEWWGARCISIYDKSLDRYVVIGASSTD